MANNNNPDRPIYKVDAYRWLNKDETLCLLCSTDEHQKVIKTVKYSYSALITHLRLHPVHFKNYEELTKKEQPPITRFCTNHVGVLTPLDRRVVHFLATNYMPFNSALFNYGNGKVSEVLKGSKHYRDFVLPKVYKYCVIAIQQKLSDCQHLSFTCDVGSGPNCSFFALTAHGINAKWERVRYVLAVREFRGHRTGEAVRNLVHAVLDEWHIPVEKVHCFVHDEGSDMESAFKADSIEDFLCGAHKLNLVVRNGMWPNAKKGEQPTQISKLLSRCRDLVGHFRHSHLASESLERLLKQHKLDVKQPIQDVATRWDSTFLMVHRLLYLRPALDAYCVSTRQELLLVEADWKVLKEIDELLTPFTEFSKHMCRDSAPLGFHLTTAKMIEAELGTNKSAALQEQVNKMSRIASEKFGGMDMYKNVAVAHALDPRFKDTLLVGDDATDFRSNCLAWIGDHAGEVNSGGIAVAELSRSPPTKKRSFLEGIRAKLQGSSVRGASSSQPVQSSADFVTEFLKYLGEPTEDWDSDPLDYWRENAARFPQIAPIARRFLGAPATSVASEQTFSIIKCVFDPRRSKLSAHKAEALVFLNRNLPLLDYQGIRAKLQGSSVRGASSSQPVQSSADFVTEFLKYLGEPTEDWDSDPLDYWRENAARFPQIAPIARRFLGAPATSVASEQTFSIIKCVFDPRRSKLSAHKAEALVFLNRNLPLLDYQGIRAKLQGSSVRGASSSQPVQSSADFVTEFLKYLGEPTEDWDSDPLDYWRENAARFPQIAPIARRFLGAPATSVASEQTFSIIKCVFDPRRSKLSAHKAEALVFLNRNLPLLDYRY
ncbi:zinc finger protein [Aphelenchoides avenae]|nr:zinc finger protein [Aphelenchus avenae]